MAKNWTAAEAAKAIKEGNKADIIDIGRRFPLFANLAAQVNDAGVKLLECAPPYMTARKIESVLKDGVQVADENDSENENDGEDETPAKKEDKSEKKPAKEEKKKNENVIEGKSAKELYTMCIEAGIKVKPKQDKEVYIKALKDAAAKAAKAAKAQESKEEDDWDEEEEEEKPAKKEKKADKKADKKQSKEEDDDWDI